MTSPLFRPLQLGPLKLPNRVLMSPMTRNRATQPGDEPSELNATYYAQRSSAGLILTEATQISPQGKGLAYTPGMYNDAQVAGWKLVTEAVHATGGRIHAQLWHVGRLSHEFFHGGAPPVSASAVPTKTHVFLSAKRGFAPASPPRALTTEEVGQVVTDFRRGAERAKEAGFDGVELHGGNGYLIHQFLADNCNRRDDRYGGSIAGRIRFPLEVLGALCEVWGPERVGVRVTPGLPVQGCEESDPEPLYRTFAEECQRLSLAYIDVVEFFGRPADKPERTAPHRAIRESFQGCYFGNGGYDQAQAEASIERGDVDAVLFGKPFISNPDLPERFRRGAELAAWDKATFYGGSSAGYTDYAPLAPTD